MLPYRDLHSIFFQLDTLAKATPYRQWYFPAYQLLSKVPLLSKASQLSTGKQLSKSQQQSPSQQALQSQQQSERDSLLVLRLDQLTLPSVPQLSGNKLFKLLANLQSYLLENKTHLVSYGGAWSNHAWSLSCAIQAYQGLEDTNLTLFVRGERPALLSPTLQDIEQTGALLHFIPRSTYDACAYQFESKQHRLVPQLLKGIKPQQIAILPSGGSNVLGLLGAIRYGAFLARAYPGYDILCAAGTGGFALGLAMGIVAESAKTASVSETRLLALVVADHGVDSVAVITHSNLQLLKACWRYLKVYQQELDPLVAALVNQWPEEPKTLQYLPLTYIGRRASGGKTHFGRLSNQDKRYIASFEQYNDTVLDPVYLGPLVCYAGQTQRQLSRAAARPLALLHTGGQQGARPIKPMT